MQGNDVVDGVQVKWPVDLSHMRPEDAAEWLVARYGGGVMPIRPEKIAQQLGVRVRDQIPQDTQSVFVEPDGTLGLVTHPREHIHRRRFAVAHGLGHILLRHGPQALEGPESFGNDAVSPLDQAANRFAASLLVPTEDLRWCFSSGWMRNVEQIAETLWVPMGLIAYRHAQLVGSR